MRDGELDLLIRDVALADHEEVTPHIDIGCRDGHIAIIARAGEITRARHKIEASGLVALPGIIDGHVHFREPGLEHKEKFSTGSAAAVLGGVTCVLDMPNTEPPLLDAASFREKVNLIGKGSWADFGLFGLLSAGADQAASQIAELAEAGVAGIKAFMGQSESGPGCPAPPDDGILFIAMRAAAQAGIRFAVHAENHDVMMRLRSELMAAGQRGLGAHLATRPPFVEVEAIQRACVLAKAAGAALHVLHLSSAAGLAEVSRWRRDGLDVTAEATPHHCFADPARVGRPVTLKVNPPIRGGGDAAALLAGMRDGRVGSMASDHAPHAPDERGGEDVWSCRAGLPGVGTMLQVTLAAGVGGGVLSMSDVARVLAYAPSRIWGLYPRKGTVRVGSDADLTLVDESATWRIPNDDRGAFAGMAGRGRAMATIIRGRVAMWDGQLGDAPYGRLVKAGGRRRTRK
jgi:dihydroorotase